jgi:3-methyladenine DNA glycosylase AlkD
MFKQILQELKYHETPDQAAPMAKYMKNRFPFLGLTRPTRNKIQAGFLQAARKQPELNWDFVLQCWDLPEREYQYLAVDYLCARVRLLQKEDLTKLEILISQKSWWDTVDIIAVKLVGELCLKHPELTDAYILPWAASDNIWLARTAILFQLKYKQNTNTILLNRIILLNNKSQEFFINKAIGWILREYSKSNQEWVKNFIANNPLHPLSIREGSKYL